MKKKKTSGFLLCILYIAVLGVAAFVTGRLLPKRIFKCDAFPFKTRVGEKKLYERLHVKDWQAKVPDMSRIFKKIMPEKRISADTLADLPRMLQETCVAESVHAAECVLGLVCLWLWPGIGGVVMTLIYILFGNLPFIIIQRYNRPRLQRLLARRESRAKAERRAS